MRTSEIEVGGEYAFSEHKESTLRAERWAPAHVRVLNTGLTRQVHDHFGVGHHDSTTKDGVLVEFLDSGRPQVIVPSRHILRPWSEQEKIDEELGAIEAEKQKVRDALNEKANNIRDRLIELGLNPLVWANTRDNIELHLIEEDADWLIEAIEDWLT